MQNQHKSGFSRKKKAKNAMYEKKKGNLCVVTAGNHQYDNPAEPIGFVGQNNYMGGHYGKVQKVDVTRTCNRYVYRTAGRLRRR